MMIVKLVVRFVIKFDLSVCLIILRCIFICFWRWSSWWLLCIFCGFIFSGNLLILLVLGWCVIFCWCGWSMLVCNWFFSCSGVLLILFLKLVLKIWNFLCVFFGVFLVSCFCSFGVYLIGFFGMSVLCFVFLKGKWMCKLRLLMLNLFVLLCLCIVVLLISLMVLLGSLLIGVRLWVCYWWSVVVFLVWFGIILILCFWSNFVLVFVVRWKVRCWIICKVWRFFWF